MRTDSGTSGRAWRLLLLDIRLGMRRIWPTAAVLAGLYAAYLAVTLMMGRDVGLDERSSVLFLAAMLFSFCVPAVVYGYVTDVSDGLRYVMLPVPTVVKFGVMLVVSTVIFPFCFYLCIYLMGGIFSSSGPFWVFWADFGKICLNQSVFFLGNLLLRRHKIAFTALAMLLIHAVFSGLFHADGVWGNVLTALYSYAAPVAIWGLSYCRLKHLQYP